MRKIFLAFTLGFASAASFAQVTPSFTYFGALPAATFGGTGIPNTDVAVTTFGTPGVRSETVFLGLTATPRYSAPALTNDGLGTLTALAGAPDLTKPTYAGWNVSYAVLNPVAGQTYALFADSVPVSLGGIPIGAFGVPLQGSWNLGMTFLGGGTFNPNANGNHTFALAAFNTLGEEIGRSAINVSAVPEPETYAMMLAGLGALGFVAKRRKSIQA